MVWVDKDYRYTSSAVSVLRSTAVRYAQPMSGTAHLPGSSLWPWRTLAAMRQRGAQIGCYISDRYIPCSLFQSGNLVMPSLRQSPPQLYRPHFQMKVNARVETRKRWLLPLGSERNVSNGSGTILAPGWTPHARRDHHNLRLKDEDIPVPKPLLNHPPLCDHVFGQG